MNTDVSVVKLASLFDSWNITTTTSDENLSVTQAQMFTVEVMFWDVIHLQFSWIDNFPDPQVATGVLMKHNVPLGKLMDLSGLNIFGNTWDNTSTQLIDNSFSVPAC